MERRGTKGSLQGDGYRQAATEKLATGFMGVHGLLRTVDRGTSIPPPDNLHKERCYCDSLANVTQTNPQAIFCAHKQHHHCILVVRCSSS
jgi:hypothetical protein